MTRAEVIDTKQKGNAVFAASVVSIIEYLVNKTFLVVNIDVKSEKNYNGTS